jgi:hypothetical protein
MDPRSLTKDFREFLQCLNARGVEFLVIGGRPLPLMKPIELLRLVCRDCGIDEQGLGADRPERSVGADDICRCFQLEDPSSPGTLDGDTTGRLISQLRQSQSRWCTWRHDIGDEEDGIQSHIGDAVGRLKSRDGLRVVENDVPLVAEQFPASIVI